MASIATVTTYDGTGKRIASRRCDARCYNGEHDHCNCICGGKNHGVGYHQALAQLTELTDLWMNNIEGIVLKIRDVASGKLIVKE